MAGAWERTVLNCWACHTRRDHDLRGVIQLLWVEGGERRQRQARPAMVQGTRGKAVHAIGHGGRSHGTPPTL